MEWTVQVTDLFVSWWTQLAEKEQDDVCAAAWLLGEWGPYPRFPHSSWINQSRHRHMRELRIRSGGSPFRLMYAFDPRRVTILVIGGDKGCKDGQYPQCIARADRIYQLHLEQLDQQEV